MRRTPLLWRGRLPPRLRVIRAILLGLLLALAVAGCTWPAAEPTATPAWLPGATPPPTLLPQAPEVSIPEGTDSEGATMSLTVVFDNNPPLSIPATPAASRAPASALQTGWGFAAWLVYDGRTVLFDTGADGAVLLGNLAALGLNPADVEIVVLSHNHGDHTGGLARLLAANPDVTVYLPAAFPERFKAQVRAATAAVVEVNGPREILPGLWSTGQMGSDLVEQALVARTGEGLVVVTGCAHPGVADMVARAREVGGGEVALVVGGFHLGSAGRVQVEEIIARFRQLGVRQVAPCHCTGDEARAMFQEAYGPDYHACALGWQWPVVGGRAPAWTWAAEGIPAQVGVAAVAVAPGDPRVVYLAAYEPGGIYRSTDGGDSWQVAGCGLESLSPLALAVHPHDRDMAWLGTAVGGYRTVDGGRSWQPMTGLPKEPIYALAVAPEGGTLYAGCESPGVWRSADGGRTWRQTGADNEPGTVLSLALTPGSALLAGTAGQGLWRSVDGGASWRQAGEALAEAYVTQLSTMDDRTWYAVAESHLYFSDDEGQSWRAVGPEDFPALSLVSAPGGRLYLGSKGSGVATSDDGDQAWDLLGGELYHADVTCLAIDPARPGRVFLGTRHNGLHCTEDGGATWSLVSGAVGQPAVLALAQDPVDSGVYYAGALDGVYRSDDGGKQWHLVSGNLGQLLVQALAVGPEGTQVYAGTRSGLYTSDDGGATWRWAEEDTGGITIFDVVVDPHDASRIYAGSWGHNVLRSDDRGATWTPVHSGLETLSVHAFAVDPADPRLLYAGTVEAVYLSRDGGASWQARPLTDRPLTVFALLIDPADPAQIYAGTTEGVYRSQDGGRAWQPAGHESLAATVTALSLLPDETGTILAGTEHSGLYASRDGGASWQPWGAGTAGVYAILVDRDGTIWLGTDGGIFRGQ